MKNSIRILLAGGLLAAAGCSSPEPEEKFLLRAAPAKGLAVVRDVNEKSTGWLSVRADGAETRQALGKDEHRVFEDEILEVDGARVLKLRRTHTLWDLKRQTPGDAAPVSVPRTLVGKSIVLVRTDLGTEYEEAEGLPEEELKANLLGSLEALVSPPSQPVAVGAEWVVDGDRIVEMFGGEGSSRALKVRWVTGTGRLDSIDGTGIAHLSVRLKAGGAFRSLLDVDVELDLTARFRFDLRTSRPRDYDAHAEGRISGEVDRKGKPAVYSGAFMVDASGILTYRR
jgi:hypothetical protein